MQIYDVDIRPGYGWEKRPSDSAVQFAVGHRSFPSITTIIFHAISLEQEAEEVQYTGAGGYKLKLGRILEMLLDF